MKKDEYIFPAILSYDSDGIKITFPDLQGCRGSVHGRQPKKPYFL